MGRMTDQTILSAILNAIAGIPPVVGHDLALPVTEDVTIQWQNDGAANQNWQDIDLDSYYTVPGSPTRVNILYDVRDNTPGSYLFVGGVESALRVHAIGMQVANISVYGALIVPLAAGNILKVQTIAINPGDFARIWFRVIEWLYD